MTIEMTLLRSIALFKNSDEETLTKISQHARLRKLKSGTNILTQGDKGETLFVIVSGTVKITLTQSSGDEVFLALLSTGDTFGEMSLIDSNLRSANVLAKEETVLLLLEGACFEHLLSISTAFVKNLLNVLVCGRCSFADVARAH